MELPTAMDAEATLLVTRWGTRGERLDKEKKKIASRNHNTPEENCKREKQKNGEPITSLPNVNQWFGGNFTRPGGNFLFL